MAKKTTEKKRKISHAGARQKGLSFERKIANDLRVVFPNAARQLEFQKDCAKGIDLRETGRFKFQCKKLKAYAPITCLSEVVCDSALGDIAVLVTAGDNKPPVAVLSFEDFLELLQIATARVRHTL
jgi:hypothetical protein